MRVIFYYNSLQDHIFQKIFNNDMSQLKLVELSTYQQFNMNMLVKLVIHYFKSKTNSLKSSSLIFFLNSELDNIF